MGLGEFIRFEVGNGCGKQLSAVLESSQSSIAMGAQQRPNGPCGLAVIDGKIDSPAFPLATGRKFADSADAPLSGKHGIVLVECDPVAHEKVSGSLLLFLAGASGFFKDTFHVRKVGVNGLKFACSAVVSRMFSARSNVQKHTLMGVMYPAVAAWFKFPSGRSGLDPRIIPPVDTRVFLAPLVESFKRALFALVIYPVNAMHLGRKILGHFRLLASGAQPLPIRYRRDRFADVFPVAAQFFRGSGVFTESTGNQSFTGHIAILPSCMRFASQNLTIGQME